MVLIMAVLMLIPLGGAIDLTATGDIQDWSLTPGSNNENATMIKLVVSSTNSSWSVSVMDNLDTGKNSASAGRMLEYNSTTGWVSSGKILANNLTVIGESAEGISGSEALLGPIAFPIETGSLPASEKQMNITVRQPVLVTDPRLVNGNVYRVVITFIGGET